MFTNTIYGNIISISRPNNVLPTATFPPSVRSLPYSGLVPTDETLIYDRIPALVHYQGGTQRADNKVPGDVAPGMWKVIIPAYIAGYGTINRRDIVTDDLGQRMQVVVNHFTLLGYNLSCRLLEL